MHNQAPLLASRCSPAFTADETALTKSVAVELEETARLTSRAGCVIDVWSCDRIMHRGNCELIGYADQETGATRFTRIRFSLAPDNHVALEVSLLANKTLCVTVGCKTYSSVHMTSASSSSIVAFAEMCWAACEPLQTELTEEELAQLDMLDDEHWH
jgi:hypothetical protein